MSATLPIVLSVTSGKGGVGKTTLACNVASDLAETEDLNILLVGAVPQWNAPQ